MLSDDDDDDDDDKLDETINENLKTMEDIHKNTPKLILWIILNVPSAK